MGQFVVFCWGYGSCVVSFALVMGLLYGDFSQLWPIHVLQFIANVFNDKIICEKDFAPQMMQNIVFS